MIKLFVAVAIAAGTLAGSVAGAGETVDLTQQGALDRLRVTNPAHYEKIARIVAGLAEEPQRAETDWLQTTFNAQDVNLSRLLVLTSDPPKQSLSFTLDDVRYSMRVTRSDLTASIRPAK
jgi:hypothetical protein